MLYEVFLCNGESSGVEIFHNCAGWRGSSTLLSHGKKLVGRRYKYRWSRI